MRAKPLPQTTVVSLRKQMIVERSEHWAEAVRVVELPTCVAGGSAEAIGLLIRGELAFEQAVPVYAADLSCLFAPDKLKSLRARNERPHDERFS
jgi:hypothetical protein